MSKEKETVLTGQNKRVVPRKHWGGIILGRGVGDGKKQQILGGKKR